MREEIDGPITQLSSYKKIHAELLNELKDIEQDAKSKHINDSLCVLYVALTRAKERLEIITQKEPKIRPYMYVVYVGNFINLKAGYLGIM